jgi:nucleoid DNA-binding protein
LRNPSPKGKGLRKPFVQAFLDKTTEYLAEGYRHEFRDFGIFEVVERKQKIERNPKKPEEKIVIPPRLVAKWTPGKKMRELRLGRKSDGNGKPAITLTDHFIFPIVFFLFGRHGHKAPPFSHEVKSF